MLLDENILRDASAGLLRSLGPDHSQTATAAYQLANVLAAQGKKEEALEQLQFAATHTLPEEDFADAQTSAEFATLKVDTRFAAIQAAFRKRASASR